MRFWRWIFSTRDKKNRKKRLALHFVSSPEFAIEPGTRVIPVTVRGGGRDAECLAGLVHGQAREITQSNELTGDRIVYRKFRERLVDGKQLVRRERGGQRHRVEVDPLDSKNQAQIDIGRGHAVDDRQLVSRPVENCLK